MTKHDSGGSSFIQTPPPDIHRRYLHHHLHRQRDADNVHHYMHMHIHRQHNQHVRSDSQPVPKTPEPELDADADLLRRQADGANDTDAPLTRIIRTISVIKYVDGSGSTVDISTLSSPPVTEVVAEGTATTRTTYPADSSSLAPPPTATSSLTLSPGSSPASSLPSSSSTLSSSSTSSSGLPSSSLTGSTPPVPTTFLSSIASSPPSIINSTAFPSLTGSFNSSSSSSTLTFSNSTIRNFFTNSSSTSTSLTTSESSSTSSTSSESSSTSRSQTMHITTTSSAAGASGAFGPGDGVAAPTSPVDITPVPASGPPTPTNAIVGGVVGSICGVALLVFVIVFLLRMRKQQQQVGHLRLADGDAAPPGSSGTGLSRGFSTHMSQRGTPFSVPAALAALSGAGTAKQLTSPSSAGGSGEGEAGERGFYRVSGRKLPSVLQHGGDGYSNPHDSTMSGESEIMYRDSQAFFTGAAPTRLAVGSPMRPESGIAVMQPGPARTPVAGLSPLLDNSPTMSPKEEDKDTVRQSLMPRPLAPTPPPSSSRTDGLGQSRSSMDSSRVSVSRFTENIS